ncbi:MAG: hypothetical protein QOJ67_2910 [Acidimicrobiaceae bacterium]
MTTLTETVEDTDSKDAPDARATRNLNRLAFASVLAAISPIVVAATRAIRWGWIPIGDNAYFTIRARDVLSTHPPLLGTWTSASLSVGKDINNPGPLLYDLLALPVRVNQQWGVALGSALLNVLAVIGIALVARRIGGAPMVIAGMALAAAMEWAMGSELLYEPWQPHSLLLPFVCLLMLAWGLLQGDIVLVPFTAFVASLILQTHVGYLYLVSGLVLWAMTGLVLLERRRAKAPDVDPDAAAKQRRRWKTVSISTAVVMALCWAQPLIEQLTSSGEGNLSRLASSAGQAKEVAGANLGVRIAASVLALPPFWGRPSFSELLRPADGTQILPGVGSIGGLSSTPLAVASLAAVMLLLAACAWWRWRRDDRLSASAAVTALFLVIIATATCVTMPVGILGVAPHQVRWLWPIGIFAAFSLAVALARWRSSSSVLGRGVVVFAIAAFGLSLATIPEYIPDGSGNADHDTVASVRELDRQMGAVEGKGTILFDPDGMPIFEPYTTALQAELQRRGIDFVVDSPVLLRQLGDHHANHGQAHVRLFVRAGEAALTEQPGAERVALVSTDKIAVAVFLAPIP